MGDSHRSTAQPLIVDWPMHIIKFCCAVRIQTATMIQHYHILICQLLMWLQLTPKRFLHGFYTILIFSIKFIIDCFSESRWSGIHYIHILKYFFGLTWKIRKGKMQYINKYSNHVKDLLLILCVVFCTRNYIIYKKRQMIPSQNWSRPTKKLPFVQ